MQRLEGRVQPLIVPMEELDIDKRELQRERAR